jgi:hypothetical protein
MGEQEFQQLKESLAEAEELLAEFLIEQYREAQRAYGEAERLSKELEPMLSGSDRSG